eukprot:2995738-Rhodomonas_salina.3
MAPRGEGVGGLTSHMRSMGLDGSAPPPLTPTPPPSIWREKKKSGAAAPSSAAAGAQPGSSGPPQGAQWEWKAFTNTAVKNTVSASRAVRCPGLTWSGVPEDRWVGVAALAEEGRACGGVSVLAVQ